MIKKDLLKNKVVLVTGGAGFIGSHLCTESLKKGAKKVFALDNFVASRQKNLRHLVKDNRFELISGDIRDYETVLPLVKKSDFIFHEAASKLVASLKNPRIDLGTNITGTFNILEAARHTTARIIHASTGSVLGSSEEPMQEDHEKNPTTLYGISKLTAEKYCEFYAKEFEVRVSVLRYFHVFGPRQDYYGEAGVINIFLSRILNGLPPIINGTGEQIRCFTYVKDDVDANFLLASKDETIGEVYNVASKTRISVKDLAFKLVEKYAEKNLEPQYAPARPGENLKPIPNAKKIEALGFKETVSFEEGLDLTKQWIEHDMIEDTY